MTIAPSPAVPSNPSHQLLAALRWAEAVTNADFEQLEDAITEDYVHVLLPASLGVPQVQGRDEVIKGYKGILSLFTSFVVSNVPQAILRHVTPAHRYDRSHR